MNEKVFNGALARLREPSRVEALEFDRVVSLVTDRLKVTSTLDVGTGSGIFAEAFALRGFAVAGIDINEAMVIEAKRLVPTGDFKVGSAEKLPYEDMAFDLVFLGHVLHEADDAVKALSEARRVAKQRVAVLEWPYIEEPAGPPLAHRLRSDQVKDSAEKVGFKQVESISLKHMVLYRMDIS